MGARLALEAFSFCNARNVPPVARAVLVYMALRALDEPSASGQPARRSFLRRSELGLAIGRMMPDREPPADAPIEQRREWDAADQAIVRALRLLKKEQGIREVAAGRAGRTVEYELVMAGALFTERPPETDTHVSTGGRLVTFSTDAQRPPKEPLMNQKKTGMTKSPQASILRASVDNRDETRDIA